MNILIVEDNLKMRRMIKSIVADLAERIDECDDGGKAFALYAENNPDWVLMDIHLKEETNGVAATRIFAHRRATRARSITCLRKICSTCGGFCKKYKHLS